MSRGEDTRIVQMQFDNKSFERNIATSQKSLARFKKSLNFEGVTKGLNRFLDNAKGLALDTLSDNIQRLTDKFTGMGNAGEYVISRLRAGFEGLLMQAEQFIKTMTLEQVKVGQDKYDALTKSVQTIVASGSATEEQAYGVMERVMAYTDQTSHSFQTMVAQISSLTSIGVPLSQAEKMMEGFANASTKAGGDASKAAVAMQVYAKAMGSYMTKQEFDTLNLTARVVTKEWREQVIEAGLACKNLEKDTKGVIRTAAKFGKQVVVTADTIENSFNKKWATRDVWAKFAEKYGFGETIEELQHPEKVMDSFGKEAYLTGQRALTFADALGAVKESISGGWMNTFRILFGDLTDAMNLWTGSCNKVIDALYGLQEARNAVLGAWSDAGGRDALLAAIFGEMVDTEGNVMYEGAYGLLDVMSDIGSLISEGFWSMIQMFLPEDMYNESLETWGTNTEYQFWALGNMLSEFTTNVRNAIENLKAFFNEKPDGSTKTRWDQVRDVVNAVFGTIALFAKGVEGLLYFFGLIGEQLSPSAEKLGNLFSELGMDVKEGETDIVRSNKIKKFFDELAALLKPFTDMVNDLVGAFTDLVLAISGSEETEKAGNSFFGTLWNLFKDGLGFLESVFRPITDFIVEVMGIIGDLFKDGFDEKKVEDAKTRFSAAFERLWARLKLVFDPIVEKIGFFFSQLWENIKQKVTEYFNDPKSLGYKILQPIKKVVNFLQPVWNFLSTIWGKIKGIFVGKDGQLQGPTLFDSLKAIFLSEGVTKLFNKLKELGQNGGLYKLLLGVLGGVAIFRIIKAVNTIGGFFDDVGGNLKAGILGTYEWFSEKIQGIAKGLLMLTAAVAILGSMDTNDVIQGVVALGIIMLEFVGFMKLMDVVNPATITKQMLLTGAMTAFAAAIAALVISLLPFALVGWEGFARMILGLTLVLGALVGFMKLMQVLSLDAETGLKFGGIMRFALAIGILMFSLVPLMMTNWEGMFRAVIGLGLVLGELIGFMKLMQILDLKAKKGLKFGGIVRFSIAVAILMLSLVPFMLAGWEGMLRGVIGLGLVLAELIGFMKLMQVLNLKAGESLSFDGIVRFGIAVAILMLSLIPFMITDWSGMLRAVVGLGLVLAELIGFMWLLQRLMLFTDNLKIEGFAGFALAIGILMLSLIPFMSTDWGGMLRAVLGLGLVLAELIGFMKLMQVLQLSTFGLNFAGIIGFAVGVAVMILAIKNFADMGWEGLARSIVGLTALFGELLGFMALLNLIPIKPSAIGMVIAICLSIGVMAVLLSVAMNEVRNLRWEVIAAFAAGMSAIVVTLAAAILSLSAVPFTSGLKAIGLLSLGIAAILGIVALLGPAIIRSIGDALASIGGKLELASGLLKNFSDRMGSVNEGNVDKAETIFDKLGRILTKLNGWKKFTGTMDNFYYAMFALGTGIEMFNNHVGSAGAGLDKNSEKALKFIEDLGACAGDLTTIEGMDMDNLTSKISALGGALYIFAKGAKESKDIEIGTIPNIDGAVSLIGALGRAFNNGETEFEIPENMPDADAMSLFGASIAALATGLVAFEEAGKDLGSGTAQALRTIDFFAQLKERLIANDFNKNLGAAVGVFNKEKVDKSQLVEFAANIEQLGLAMTRFYESVTVMDSVSGERKPIDLSAAITTIDSIISLEGKLGWDFGPVIQFFAGRTKDFTDLGSEIEALGTALSDFMDKLGGVDENGKSQFDPTLFEEALKVSEKVVDYLKQLGERMGRTGGLWNAIKGAFAGHDYNFTDLKTQIQDLAEGIGSLGQLKVDEKLITVDDTTGIFKAVDSIIDYMDTLKTRFGKVGGLLNGIETFVFGKDYDFTDLRIQLTALGEGLNGLTGFKMEDLPTAEEMQTAFPMIDALLAYLDALKVKQGQVGGVFNDVSDFFDGYDFTFKDLKDQLVALGEGLGAIANLEVDPEGKTIFNQMGTKAVTDTMDLLIDYMRSLTGKLGNVGGLGEVLKTIFAGKGADFEYLGHQLSHLGEGLGSFQTGITKNGEFDADKVSKALGALDHLVSLMQTFSVLEEKMDAISQSYGASSYTMKDFMVNLWDGLFMMTEGFDNNGERYGSVVDRLADFVKEFDSQLSELGGLDNADATDILESVSRSISTLVIAARNMQSDDGTILNFELVGENISNGIARGIANATGVIEAAARAVVIAAVKAANEQADIHSPSRVFMEVGAFMGRGLAIGFREQTDNVEEAVANTTDDAIETAGSAMSLFAQLMSQDIDTNPTITPVLDLSLMESGVETLNQMLGNDPYWRINDPSVNMPMNSVEGNQNGTVNDYTDNINRVAVEVANMRQEVNNLADAMKHIRLVMNTGEVVGAIGPQMDEYLGRSGFYYARR